ncbi:MAG: aspartate carbamoyltransferase [Planctomycetota bacterium]
MNFRGRDVISIRDFSRAEILSILRLAARMERAAPPRLLDGRTLATLFFEPSTRTRLSFESAMQRLGGRVVGFADPSSTSAKKGETLADTIRMAEHYADVIVIRHPLEGSARLAAEVASIPVINGGDGANQHPTQTFVDLFTIAKTHPGLLSGRGRPLEIGFVGDLKYGRTVHSLVTALCHFPVRFVFLSPASLKMPEPFLRIVRDAKVPFEEAEEAEAFLPRLDILYATRIQAERFPDPIEYERVRNTYRLTADKLSDVKSGFRILHPLPRVNEIATDVDATPHAWYFRQAANGIPMRQAILAAVLGRLR